MLTALTVVAIAVASQMNLVSGEATLVSEGYLFSEGPVWIPGTGLIFSDVMGNTVYTADHEVYRKPSQRTNGMALDSEGRILACESGLKRISRIEADGSTTVLAQGVDGKSFNSTNDIAVRSDGLIYFTDPGATSKTDMDVNGVYRLDPASGEVTLLSDTARYPNGIGFSPDEKTLYVGDYMGGTLRAYDVNADGSVSNERDFASVKGPDGFAVDSEGRIWVAGREGVVVIGTDGKQAGVLDIPVPTNCCFGGPDGKTLFVTARKKVFKIQTNTTGLGKF